MHYSTFIAAISLVTFSFNTCAQSQDACTGLIKYLQSSKDGFSSITGGKATDYGDEFYTTFNLPNANRCLVAPQYDRNVARVECKYLFIDNKDREDGIKQIDSGILKCLNATHADLSNENIPKAGARGLKIGVSRIGEYDVSIIIDLIK